MRRSFCRMRGAPRLQPVSRQHLSAQLPGTPMAIQVRHVRTPRSFLDFGLRGRCCQRVSNCHAVAFELLWHAWLILHRNVLALLAYVYA